MQIQKISITPQIKQKNIQEKQISSTPIQNCDYNREYASTSQIPFCANLGIIPKKLSHIDADKNKLLKQIAEMFKFQPEDFDIKEIARVALRDSIRHIRTKNKRLKEIEKEVDWINADKKLKLQQKIDRLRELKKEAERIQKSKPKPSINFDKKTDERTDFVLLSKIRAAVIEDEFNLRKIFAEYFGGLKDIKTVDELQEIYPKIKIPPRPDEIIGKKIENVLTKDFYEKFGKLWDEDNHKAFKYVNKVIKEKISLIAEKYGTDTKELYRAVARPAFRAVANRFKSIRINGPTTIPTSVKNPTPAVSDIDLKLLQVDYDDFVLSTIRKHYLDSEKMNDIVYTSGDLSIPIKSLGNSPYKFEKLHPKIQQLLVAGDNIQKAQRNYELSLREYDRFDFSQLQARLNYYANHDLANNEDLFNYIFRFNDCHEADSPQLKTLLRELDEVKDGNKTTEQAVEFLTQEDVTPKEQLRLDELEAKKAFEQLKIESQKNYQLKSIKDGIDEITEALYKHNMNTLAISIGEKYRPEKFDENTLKDCQYIIDTAKKHLNATEFNKTKLESEITNWETYKLYKECDPKNPTYLKAIKFATNEAGEIDINKAGQYIKNAEIVEEYVEHGTIIHPEPELFQKIIEKTEYQNPVEYLCKYDEYQDMLPSEQTHIFKFIDMFDRKNVIDNTILEHIIKNDYVNCDTTSKLKLNEAGDSHVNVTFASPAKQQILKKYKFPNCMEFLEGFEEAISKTAKRQSDTGIKLTGSNNKRIKYKMEAKLKDHNDRLYSSNNDYYFDIFDEKGLH